MTTEAMANSSTSASSGARGRRQILLLENELTIALEIEGIVEEAQLGEVHIAGSERTAREMLRRIERLAGAILDVNLSEGDSLQLADEILAQGVPLAFATGYDPDADFLARFAGVPIISKPFDREELLQILQDLLNSELPN